ncbi:hypothetical protein KC328_g18529, partial [Hortaea werneckii]
MAPFKLIRFQPISSAALDDKKDWFRHHRKTGIKGTEWCSTSPVISSKTFSHTLSHKASPSKLTIRRELMEQGDVFESIRGESDQQKTKRSNHKKKLSRLSRTASEWAVQLTSEYDYLMPSALSCKLEIEQVAQKQAELAEIME